MNNSNLFGFNSSSTTSNLPKPTLFGNPESQSSQSKLGQLPNVGNQTVKRSLSRQEAVSAKKTNLFGQSGSHQSGFAANNQFGGNFGQNQFPSGFGTTSNADQQTPNLFGQPQNVTGSSENRFGATIPTPQTNIQNSNLFGQQQPQSATNLFGQSQQGHQMKTNLFGTSSSTNQSASSNFFQQPSSTNIEKSSKNIETKNLFGNPASSSLFPSQSASQSFAKPNVSSPLFGGKSNTGSHFSKPGLFGKNTTTTTESNLFGKAESQSQHKSLTPLFGQPQTKSETPLFGQKTTTPGQFSTGLFGKKSQASSIKNITGQQNFPDSSTSSKPQSVLFGKPTTTLPKPSATSNQNVVTSSGLFGGAIPQSNLSRKRSLDSETATFADTSDGLFEGKKPLKRVAHQPATGLFGGVKSTSPEFPVSQTADPRIKRRIGGIRSSVRRQISSGQSDAAAVSTSNSLVCTTVPNEFNSKEMLKKHFSKFGRVVRITNNLSNKSATVRFFSHEEAAKAKMNGKSLFGKQIHIYFSKPKRQSTDKLEDATRNSDLPKSKQGKTDISQQGGLFKTPFGESQFHTEIAKSDSEKLAVLEKVEKVLRSRIVKQSDLSKAKVMKGTCPDMCPEKERYLRQHRNLLHYYELGPNKTFDHLLVVKEYSRSSADQEEPLPQDIRSSGALRLTMDYLLTTVLRNIDHDRIADWYDFIWNRTRAIRKEISIQQLKDPIAVQVAEECARFHISCAHELCEEDRMNFDPKINNENLEKTMKTVLDMYSDLKLQQGRDLQQVNEAEFQSYHILLNINRSADVLRELQNMTAEVRSSKDVQLAVATFSSLHSNNYARFFNAVKHATYLQACIMHRYFQQVRKHAISTLARAYSTSKSNAILPVEKICRTLHFNDENQFKDFCVEHMVVIREGNIELARNESYEPESSPVLSRSDLISNKIHGLLFCEVIAHGRTPSNEVYQPMSSFDANGRYVGPHLSLVEKQDEVKSEPSTSVDQLQKTGIANSEVKLIAKELFVEVIDEMVLKLSNEIIFATKIVIHSNRIFYDVIEESICLQAKEVSTEVLLEENQRLLEMKEQKLLDEKRKREEEEMREKMMEQKKKEEKEKEQATDRIVDEITSETVSEFVEFTVKQEYRAAKIEYFSGLFCDEVLNRNISTMLDSLVAGVIVDERKKLHRQKYVQVQALLLANYFKRWQKALGRLRRNRHARQMFLSGPIKRDVNAQVNELVGCEVNDLEMRRRGSFPLDAHNKSRLSLESLYRLHDTHKKVSSVLEDQGNSHLLCKNSSLFDKLPITEIVHENITEQNCNIMWNLVVVSGDTESECCNWLRRKFGINENEDHVMHRDCFQSNLASQQTRNILVCCQILEKNPPKNDFFGRSALIFVLSKTDNVSKRMKDLEELLGSNSTLPKIPLLILNCSNNQDPNCSGIEQNNCLTGYKIISMEKENNYIRNSKNLHDGLCWLAKNTQPINLRTSTLRELLEDKITDDYIVKLCRHSALRKKLNFPALEPQIVIDIYNELIDQIVDGLTSLDYKYISWPAKQFLNTDSSLPNIDWNTDPNLEKIKLCLESIKLPDFPSLDIYEQAHKVHRKVLNYCQEVCPYKPVLFSHVNAQLSATINQFQDHIDLATNQENELTLVEWLPWQQIIDAVASSKFEDVIYSKQGNINVCYDPSLMNITMSETYSAMFKEIEFKAQDQEESYDNMQWINTEHSMLEGSAANLESMIVNVADQSELYNLSAWNEDLDITETAINELTSFQDDLLNERIENQRFEKRLQELLGS